MKLSKEEYDKLADLLRKVDIDIYCYNTDHNKSKQKFRWGNWSLLPTRNSKNTVLSIGIYRDV